jgi:hypothetical protein
LGKRENVIRLPYLVALIRKAPGASHEEGVYAVGFELNRTSREAYNVSDEALRRSRDPSSQRIIEDVLSLKTPNFLDVSVLGIKEKAYVPRVETLFAIKPHIYFPINWRKHINFITNLLVFGNRQDELLEVEYSKQR